MKIAVVGAGLILRQTHLSIITAPDFPVEISGIYSPSGQSARDTATQFGIKRVYSTPDDIREDTPDVLLVGVPIIRNAEWIIAGLEYGATVFCEKPAAAHPDQITRLRKLDPESMNRCFIAENQLFFEFHIKLRELISSVDPDEPIRFLYRVIRRYEPDEGGYMSRDWRCRPEHFGGYGYDYGIHHFTLIHRLFPELRFRSGRLSGSDFYDGYPSRMEWNFEGGRLSGKFVLDYGSDEPESSRFVIETGKRVLDVSRERIQITEPDETETEYRFEGNRLEDSFISEWNYFLRFMRGKIANPHPLNEALDEAETFWKCYEGSIGD